MEFIHEDYIHSANTLFHFMNASKFLKDALKRKALCPRYCNEDVSYLNIILGKDKFNEIAILQKCFCDIPLKEIIKQFPIRVVDKDHLTKKQIESIPEKLSHPELYGKYALAFSKKWGEASKIQPIQYLSEEAFCAPNFAKMFNKVLSQDDVDEEVASTLLNWLCFMKPLRGTMKRNSGTDTKEKFEYTVFKNFHDEHEWRFVPFDICIDGKPLESIIANDNILRLPDTIRKINDRLEKYSEVWLPFEFEDVKYIVVPDSNGRIEIINTINELDDTLFGDSINMKKDILISKILVLEDIEKDF